MLASLTGLLLTLGGDQPAVVFDPPLDPSIFDWDPDSLTLRWVGPPINDSYSLSFEDQKMVIFRPILFVVPNDEITSGSDTGSRCTGQIDYAIGLGNEGVGTASVLNPGLRTVTSIRFGDGENCNDFPFVFLEVNDLTQASSRIDEAFERIESLEQKVESLEQSLESCQCASDLDGDGAVGFNDLVQLISDWGPCSA